MSTFESFFGRARTVAFVLALIGPVGVESMAQFDPQAPEPIGPIGGAVMVAGVGPLQPKAAREFVDLAGPNAPHIVIVRTRPADPTGDPDIVSSWEAHGASSVEWLQADSAEAVSSPGVASALAGATGVWFEDGDPVRIAELLVGTPFERRIVSFLEHGGAVGAEGHAGRCFTRVLLRNDGSVARGFDFIPGSVIDTWPDAAVRARRLRSAISTQTSRVGLGIGRDAALVLKGRSLRTIGPGSITVRLAPSSRRPWRVDRIDPARGADLIALSRAAQARTAPLFPAEHPEPPVVPRGTLMLAGGGALPDRLLSRFVERAGGAEARIVFVPCSSAEVISREPARVEILRGLGAGKVTWIHTKDRARADGDAAFLAPLREATGIWFGGGRQWNFVDSYQNTTAHRLMQDVLARGGVIGGSSAGASIQASYLVRGDPLGNANIIAEGYERGFGFLPGTAVDQHFSDRGRQRDMVLLERTFPQLLGVGLDEGTAIIVSGTIAEVMARPGDRHVYLYDARDGRSPPRKLTDGARYDLRRRTPMDGSGDSRTARQGLSRSSGK